MDKKSWIIDEVNKEWGQNKGAIHATQYRPTSVKGQTTVCSYCHNLIGTYTVSNPEGKWATISINMYRNTCRCHMILHSMWDVFIILDPFDTTQNWDLFHHMDCFTLLKVVSRVEELRKTGYKILLIIWIGVENTFWPLWNYLSSPSSWLILMWLPLGLRFLRP